MIKSFVSIPDQHAYLLKFVLPDLHMDGREGRQCFQRRPGVGPEGWHMTVVQDRSGYALTTPHGLANFLMEVAVFSSHKAEVFSSREFADIRAMFTSAAKFVVKGNDPRKADDEDEFVMKILKLPLYDRMMKATELGFSRVTKTVLTVIERQFDRHVSASLRGRQKQFYSDLTAGFRKDLFLSWVPTGDEELDCMTLISFF